VASGDLVSSPLAAALDPRVDEELVQQQMRDDINPEPLATSAADSTAEAEAEQAAADNAPMA